MFIHHSQYLAMLFVLLLLRRGYINWHQRTTVERVVSTAWYILMFLIGCMVTLYMGWATWLFSMQDRLTFSPRTQWIIELILAATATIMLLQAIRLVIQAKHSDGLFWGSQGLIMASWAMSALYYVDQSPSLLWMQAISFIGSIVATCAFLLLRPRSAAKK